MRERRSFRLSALNHTQDVADTYTMHNTPERSPWTGLTGEQMLELDRRHRERKLTDRTDSSAWRSVALEAARRCAALLSANDLRGAMREAEAWAYADSQERASAEAERRRERRDLSRAMLEYRAGDSKPGQRLGHLVARPLLADRPRAKGSLEPGTNRLR